MPLGRAMIFCPGRNARYATSSSWARTTIRSGRSSVQRRNAVRSVLQGRHGFGARRLARPHAEGRVDAAELVERALHAVALAHRLAPASGEAAGELAVDEEPAQRRGERRGIARRDKESVLAIADHI